MLWPSTWNSVYGWSGGTARLRIPAEHGRIERQRLVDAMGIQLGPPEGVRSGRLETAHLRPLPRRDVGTRCVLEDGHPPLVADVEGRRDHRPAGGRDRAGQRIGIVRADIERPGRGLLGRLEATDPGRVLSADLGQSIAAVLRIGVDLDVPAEDLRVVGPRCRRIARCQIDPGRLVVDRRRRVRHGRDPP